ncbi:hypothetical protein PGTUg99_023738 [Puccinia graminis f. sp. tritici]|uniref:Uncharacterized protein n=1 Tax=Puccinia graminis f. sp. tritici TaxID=56615 RepID=A0A5B0QKQ5_PUCGR|nr:hypothetical protein PGTUg99_023738 [Puccinia graminis f. sp. tritici]
MQVASNGCSLQGQGRMASGTSDWVSKCHPPRPVRQEAVRGFVGRVGPSDLRTETLVLQDVYGPTATDPTTDGLFVSLETLPGAKTINTICTQKGLKPLMTYVIDLISNQLTLTQLNQLNLKISSTQICAWLNPH